MHVRSLLLLALLVAPAALAHGAGGLHLDSVRVSYSPLETGQRLRFHLANEGSEDARGGQVHVALEDAIMRESFSIPTVRYGESIDVDILLPERVAPRACVVVTAGTRATEEVCVNVASVYVPNML